LEDRTVPTVVVTIGSVASVKEGMPYTALATLSRTDPPIGSLTVNLGYSGTATAGSDYSGQPATVTFTPGATTAYVSFPIIDDGASEPTETLVITVEPGTGYNVGNTDTATIKLLDNDAQQVSVSKVSNTTEGGTAGLLRFTRTGNLTNAVTVNYTVGGTATSGTDYTALSGTVTFAAGVSTADVNVTALTDNVVEDDETVIATVTTGMDYNVGSPFSATVTLTDDPPVISVIPLQDGEEGVANASFRITRAGGDTTSSLTAYYSLDGTATSGSDYAALSGSITFAADSTTADVTVTVTDDSIPEPDEESRSSSRLMMAT
jgi:hypothetical protein